MIHYAFSLPHLCSITCLRKVRSESIKRRVHCGCMCAVHVCIIACVIQSKNILFKIIICENLSKSDRKSVPRVQLCELAGVKFLVNLLMCTAFDIKAILL